MILILDEPTTDLDPRSRDQVWDILCSMVKEGMTILLTTQYLEEAERLARRIAVMDQGVIIANDTAAKLRASVGSGALHVQVADDESKILAKATLERLLKAEVHDLRHQLGVVVSVPSVEVATSAMGHLLRRKKRHANETGDCYFPALKML